jgi:hypothetical protein
MSIIANGAGTPATAPDGITSGANRGLVTAPLWRTADASTGFYSPGTNQIALTSNGVLSWLVSATGAHSVGPVGGGVDHSFFGRLGLSAPTVLSVTGTVANAGSHVQVNSGITLNGAGNGVDGTVVYVSSPSGTFSISNDNGSPSSTGIITGTGATVTGLVAATLVYNATRARWVLAGRSA